MVRKTKDRRDNPVIDGPTLQDVPLPVQDAAAHVSFAQRLADWFVPENPARVIYGIIAIGTLLAAESGRHEGYPDLIGSAVIAALMFWLAHAYSDALGRRLLTAERLSLKGLWRAFVDEWAIVRGAMVPLLAILITWILGAEQETALTIALWAAVGSVVLLELAAGIRSRASPGELALDVGVGMTIGVAIFALKIVLH
jgi:hypothetical protein